MKKFAQSRESRSQLANKTPPQLRKHTVEFRGYGS